MYTFNPENLFSKGIVYAEFFDIATDNLLGYSQYVTDFGLNGTMNSGDIEGGPGNQLIMCIPDTSRLEITARTADSALNNMALPIGGELAGNGIIETMTGITATGSTLSFPENVTPVAPYGGQNGAIAYILTSSGSDKEAVEANSGFAYSVTISSDAARINGFTAVNGNTYCVKYFIQNSSALELTIPGLFAPEVVRAHFAVNCYSKNGGDDSMAGSLVKIRHYYIPYYFFTAGLQSSESQTTPGSVDLSGKALTYEQYLANGLCAGGPKQNYGFIVDEIVGDDSTGGIDGIYFIGLDAATSAGGYVNVTGEVGDTVRFDVKYSVNGILTPISDWSVVTFSFSPSSLATFNNQNRPVLTLNAAGTGTAEVMVQNTVTRQRYRDVATVLITTAGG